MPIQLESIAGVWRGTNRLLMHGPNGLEEYVSETSLRAAVELEGLALEVRYDWSHEGKTRHGLLLAGFDAKGGAVNAGWMDTFHQRAGLMICTGEEEAAASGFQVKGSFEAPEGPPWGWTIGLRAESAGRLLFEMDIITPAGESAPAVRAEYQRS
jgi:hypothetical protein